MVREPRTQALGLVFLAATTSWVALLLHVLVYGFAMGGNATLQATILAACFGRLHYGAIAGRMSPFIVFFQALAIPLAGAVRGAFGTYVPAFGVIFIANLIAVACIARLETPARPPR